MSEKTIEENPTISDKVVFELRTPNALGETISNPYEFSRLVIYFVSRDYVSGNLQKYGATDTVNGRDLNDFYFREAEPVHVVGDPDYPAWLSTDLENAFLENLESCVFRYVWEPKGMREGDYFICWTWKPLPAGDSMSSHLKFNLSADTQTTTTLPTHQTKTNKYETLLDRYMPGMFKDQLSSSDVSPDVMDRFNKSIALGFTTLEDLANQIVDLHDANSIHEFTLPYLSNYFGLKLKTDDPTRWRGQIKRAIPLYKRKGTKGGLSEALSLIGAKLKKFSQLWQVISSRTWQESFVYNESSTSFALEKQPLPVDPDNFGLWIRYRESTDWAQLDESYIEFSMDDGDAIISWIGEDNAVPIHLRDGDEIRVLYKYTEISNSDEQDLEDYIRDLPLMDTREGKSTLKVKTKEGSNVISGLPLNSDFKVGNKLYSNEFDGEAEVIEIINYSSVKLSLNALSSNNNASVTFRNFEYPPKNWNVRVITEEDPMFSIIIPERNPFFDPLVFGKIRTEFPYSENIYHMEEYNGSIRDSRNPCDIDKSFVDPCFSCVSSSYDIDIEVEELCDDKIQETKNTIVENIPFHAVLHTCNFIGSFSEFTMSPQEDIEMLLTYSGSDFVVAGHAQNYFYRIMLDFETDGIRRSELAEEESVFSGSGSCSNDEIILFCPDVVLSNVGVSTSGDSFVEIKSPSSVSGEYEVEPSEDGSIKLIIPSSVEPINVIDSPFESGALSTSAFTFDINNVLKPINGSLCNIEQENTYEMYEEGFDFHSLGIKTIKDVEAGASTYAWDIELSYGTFQVKDVVGNKIIIDNDPLLPNSKTTGETWSLKDGATEIKNSSSGTLSVSKVGVVTSLDTSFHPVKGLFIKDNYYQKVDGTEYHVSGIVNGTSDKYYLHGYDKGNMNGVTIDMREKVVKNKIGYLSYRGIKLVSTATESALGIQNGASYSGGELVDNNSFKENFIVVINEVPYWINEIDDDTMILSGKPQYFGVSSGTTVNFEVFRYNKEEDIAIQGQKTYLPDHTFPTIDRDGRSIITSSILDESGSQTVSGLSSEGEVKDIVNQQEEVSFKVEYKKGDENDK